MKHIGADTSEALTPGEEPLDPAELASIAGFMLGLEECLIAEFADIDVASLPEDEREAYWGARGSIMNSQLDSLKDIVIENRTQKF